MEKIGICIIDNNTEYRDSLVEYMNSYCRNYNINISSEEYINQLEYESDKAKDIEFDVLIIEDKILEDLLKKVSDKDSDKLIEKAITLTSHKNNMNYDDKPEVIEVFTKQQFSRYSSVDILINHINSKFYGSNLSAVNLDIPQTQLVVCMGLSGGSGVTTIAEGIGAQLVKLKEKRVFYLSLDTFESYNNSSINNKKSQEKIMYSLIKNNFENSERIIENNVIETDAGVWRLPPSAHMNILCELNTEEKKRFMKTMLEDKTFDYVVIDAGNQMNDFVEYLIQNSADIVLIDKSNSAKSHIRQGVLNSINEIKTESRANILVENYVDQSGRQTYGDAIPIYYNSELTNQNKLDSTGFNSQLKNITDFLR